VTEDSVLVQANYLKLLRELASRSLTFSEKGAVVDVPAGFDREEVERALADPELLDPNMLTFHEAWGEAKDQAGYDKHAWNRQWETYTKTTVRKTLADWRAIVYGARR
jgi:hypothetical protein